MQRPRRLTSVLALFFSGNDAVVTSSPLLRLPFAALLLEAEADERDAAFCDIRLRDVRLSSMDVDAIRVR